MLFAAVWQPTIKSHSIQTMLTNNSISFKIIIKISEIDVRLVAFFRYIGQTCWKIYGIGDI